MFAYVLLFWFNQTLLYKFYLSSCFWILTLCFAFSFFDACDSESTKLFHFFLSLLPFTLSQGGSSLAPFRVRNRRTRGLELLASDQKSKKWVAYTIYMGRKMGSKALKISSHDCDKTGPKTISFLAALLLVF